MINYINDIKGNIYKMDMIYHYNTTTKIYCFEQAQPQEKIMRLI